jgi:RNA polymerase-associated protein CTR9
MSTSLVYLLTVSSLQAMKLAERTIQFADTRTTLTEGYTRAARLANIDGSLGDAEKFFTQATSAQPTIVASIGLAQVQIKNGSFPYVPR